MAPRIRFLEGANKKRIAYAIDGSGPLLILPAWWVSHVEEDYGDPSFRELFTRLASRTTVVRYDRVGVGLSDRDTEAHSLELELATLDRLVDELSRDQVALFGMSCGGPLAIAYAARHPERVSHLILYGAYSAGPTLAREDVKAAVIALVRAHWGLGAKALFDMFAPEGTREEAQRFVEMQRASSTAERAACLLELTYQMDVSELLPKLRVPTLVLHRRKDRAIAFEHGRALAANIPEATLVPLEGTAHLPWVGDFAAVAEAVLEFVSPRERPRAAENRFAREGEVWNIAFDGAECHLKHARGFADLALLLAHPGEESHAVQLMEGVDAPSSEPVLDERARGELRERLEALDEIVARAEAAGHEKAALRAGEEREQLLRELRSATGLGGRRRALADPGERARKAVSGRIRESIEKLRAPLPALARHLDDSIATGSFCAYRPAQPIRWRT